MKKLTIASFLMLFLLIVGCSEKTTTNQDNSQDKKEEVKNDTEFKVIGYVLPDDQDYEIKNIDFQYLTHINYAFGIPTKDASGELEPLPDPKYLNNLIAKAHQENVEVFLSVGGWGIGDGGGNDTRFEQLADKEESRTRFVEVISEVLDKYNFDGVDIDWEYPDPIEPSSSNYVKLMKALKEELQPKDKKLTAAIVAYNDRHGFGVKKEIFDIVDWLNIMAYDDDYSSFGGANVPHSPYSLGVRSLEYWKERGLAPEKSVLGVPFYGKRHGKYFGYNKLVQTMDADPEADVLDSIYYNGIKTIKAKTRLAKQQGAGIMIWEIGLDTHDENSLLKAINEVKKESL